MGTPEKSKSLAHYRSAMSPSQSHAFALLPAFVWECCIIGILGDGCEGGNWRLTFEFTDGDVILLDYEDYH